MECCSQSKVTRQKSEKMTMVSVLTQFSVNFIQCVILHTSFVTNTTVFLVTLHCNGCQASTWSCCVLVKSVWQPHSSPCKSLNEKHNSLVNKSQYVAMWPIHLFFLGWEHLQWWRSWGFDGPWSHSVTPLPALCVLIYNLIKNCIRATPVVSRSYFCPSCST